MSARTSPIGSSSGEPAPGPVADEGSDRPRPSSADFREAVAFLSSTRRFGMNPSLEGIGRLADALGKPQRRFVSLLVAGTNGKSSTARMLAALLHSEGFSVGLYTSPGLVDYRDRFEIDGEVVDAASFVSAARRVRDVAQALDAACPADVAATCAPHITEFREVVASSDAEVASFTEFELLTAMSFVLFSEARVDFAVLEVGLGGRWDATNIVDEAVAVICGIGLDHQAILGETPEAIAAEKAAIIKPATSVVLGPATSEVQQVFLDRVEACDAGLCVVSPCGNRLFPDVIPELTVTYEGVATSDGLSFSVAGRHARYDGLVLPAAPSYQLANAACAVAAAEGALGRALDAKSVREAFSSCTFPGRFTVLTDDPLLIVDGAHNPQGAAALARAIDERFSGQRRPVLLLAVLADKDARGIVDALAPHVADIVVTQTSSTRARPCRELADLVESRIGHRPAVYASVTDAVDALVVKGDGTPVVAAGSITLAAELTRLFG